MGNWYFFFLIPADVNIFENVIGLLDIQNLIITDMLEWLQSWTSVIIQ